MKIKLKIGSISLLLILMGIIFLSGCVTDDQKGPESTVPFDDKEGPESTPSKDKLSECENLKEKSIQRAQCQKDVAILAGDVAICDDIKVYSNIKEECYFELAKSLEDVSLCEKLPKEKGIAGKTSSDCYIELAGCIKDESICEKIEDSEKSYTCKAIATEDSSICEQITSNVPLNYCLYKVAVTKRDSTVCEKITIGGYKTKCFEEVGK